MSASGNERCTADEQPGVVKEQTSESASESSYNQSPLGRPYVTGDIKEGVTSYSIPFLIMEHQVCNCRVFAAR